MRTCIGLVFAKEDRLKALEPHGVLTLFDSTHDVNIHGFNLFTFMVRDKYGAWIPAAHALLESESGELVGKTISTIHSWTGGKWVPQYFLTDDSAAEQLGVRLAFEGTGIETEHLLCTVHSMRTLIRRLGSHPESRKLLTDAIYAKTETECLDLIEQSIKALREWNTPNKETRDTMEKYIRNQWLPRHRQWSMHARQHCRLLLQVRSTNVVEAWHRRLKSLFKFAKGKARGHGLMGCCMNVEAAAKKMDFVAVRAKRDFTLKQVSSPVV